jgi:GMP synthase (glutamine-hydrolysing)
MRLLLVDNNSKFLKALHKNFPEATIVNCSDLKLDSFDGFDAVILSGGYGMGPIVECYQDNLREIELVKNSIIPVLGICFGCQVVAAAFGSGISRIPEKRTGEHEIELLVQNEPLFVEFAAKFTAYESHKWSVTVLGPQLSPIAKSVDGFEVIRHKNKPIFGVQFHPEVSEVPAVQQILNNFLLVVQKTNV